MIVVTTGSMITVAMGTELSKVSIGRDTVTGVGVPPGVGVGVGVGVGAGVGVGVGLVWCWCWRWRCRWCQDERKATVGTGQGQGSNECPRAGCDVDRIKTIRDIRKEQLNRRARVTHRERLARGSPDRRDNLGIDIDAFEEGGPVAGRVIQQAVSMESNGLAVGAVTQGEGYGFRTRSRIYREQGFGVGPLLAADGVQRSVRPESQSWRSPG